MARGEPVIAVGGGGTGGHVVPALAICKEILRLRPTAEIHYIGASDSLEERLATGAGLDFHRVPIAPLKRSISLRNAILPVLMIAAIIKTLQIYRRHSVTAVLTTGGFSAWPAATAAGWSRRPLAIQEQNAQPGLVSRLSANRAGRIYTAYEAAAGGFVKNAGAVRNLGNPVDLPSIGISKAEARAQLGLDPQRQTILVTGGSAGAASLNCTVMAALDAVRSLGFNLVWQAGRHGSHLRPERTGWENRLLMETFLDRTRMALAYASADAAMCRAGAMTVAELTTAALPALLVPYPFAAGGHQKANARAVEQAGGAVVIDDANLSPERFVTSLKEIMTPEAQARMSSAMAAMARPNAAAEIAEDFLAMARC